MRELQTRLLRAGQWIPLVKRADSTDLAQQAKLMASSSLQRLSLAPDLARPLYESRALLLPIAPGHVPEVTLYTKHRQSTELIAELRICSQKASFTPDVVLERIAVALPHDGHSSAVTTNGLVAGTQYFEHPSKAENQHAAATNGGTVTAVRRNKTRDVDFSANKLGTWLESTVTLRFETEIPTNCYVFICLQANELVEIYESQQLITAMTTVNHSQNSKVNVSNAQCPPKESGVDEFEFWLPQRRPHGRNLAATMDLHPMTYSIENVINGFGRPTTQPNAWVASLDDSCPTVTLEWPHPQPIRTIELVFDADWEHPMENIVMQHTERVMPTIVRNFRILGPTREVLTVVRDNHTAIVSCRLHSAITTNRISIELEHPSELIPASLYEVRCYS
jgi:hypothetical protein